MTTKKKKPNSGAKKKKTSAKKNVVKRTKPAQKTTKKTIKTKGKKQVRKKKETPKKPARARSTKVSRPAAKPARKKVKGKRPAAGAARAPQKKKKPAAKTKAVVRNKPTRTSRTSASALTSRREMLRKHLISKREEIVREVKAEIAKYTKGEANQLVETALDDGDWSVIDLSADINIRRLETHRERLLGIDEALMKLREGTYGICEECGGEITPERLKVMPFAIYCRDCQEKREQLEKIAREEGIS